MFIMHAHYMQLTTLEGLVTVRPSLSAATRKVASANVRKACGCILHIRTSLVIHYPIGPLHL